MTKSMDELLALVRRLRDPVRGCPWDLEQHYATLTRHTIEEAYEVADAIERDALEELPDELGDLLFQVVFYAQIGAEEGRFSFGDVVTAIHEKLVRRHPHVFGEAERGTASDQERAWEAVKALERNVSANRFTSEMDGIPNGLPALGRAAKLQKRAARVGFDWSSPEPVFEKVSEEFAELREAVISEARDAQEEELGDLLFAIVNLGRHLSLDAEEALRRANRKFERRFRYIEDRAAEVGRDVADVELDRLDEFWGEAKRRGL
ncbi:MAG: nucleoside triphosphate pyrophosphohydrolase [Gammaproteobacteria bacterium]